MMSVMKLKAPNNQIWDENEKISSITLLLRPPWKSNKSGLCRFGQGFIYIVSENKLS